MKTTTKVKRPKGSLHLQAGLKGLAGYAACGAYVLSTKQTVARDQVGCKECWAMILKAGAPK